MTWTLTIISQNHAGMLSSMYTFFTGAQAEGQPQAGLRGDEAVACPDEVGPGQINHRGRCPGAAAAADIYAEQAAGLQS